ncbi:MAG: Bax inhibitor-1/YccA family protein [Muribaculaceae bacterium]
MYSVNLNKEGNMDEYYEICQVKQQSDSAVVKAMQRVYSKMFIAMLISAVIATFVASKFDAVGHILGNFFGMIAVVCVQAYSLNRVEKYLGLDDIVLADMWFYIHAAIVGVLLSSMMFMLSVTSFSRVFFITAVVFGIMSLIGYITKIDLTRFGTLLLIPLVALIVLMVVNIVIGSDFLDWLITFVGVTVFIAYTVKDTQMIKKEVTKAVAEGNEIDRVVLTGALVLYYDFMNLLLHMMEAMSESDD